MGEKIEKMQRFADDSEHKFGITSPLSQAQVETLAQYWLPDIRFYPAERFHPVSLEELFSLVVSHFNSLPESVQNEWLVEEVVRAGENIAATEQYKPPIVRVPDGYVVSTENQVLPVTRVLGEGDAAENALSDDAVNPDGVITHGASFRRSNKFFGAVSTISNSPEASAGDPFVPRATDNDGNPLITVTASFVNPIELLKYELAVEEAGDNYPADAMRRSFDFWNTLMHPTSSPASFVSGEDRRKYLLDSIAVLESGGSAPSTPLGWQRNRKAWSALMNYVFLHYDFFYAYNDFNRYQDAIFANEHEGDDEGCCLVFDRGALNAVAASTDPDALKRVVPHGMISSVHEPWQHADNFKNVIPPLSLENKLARDLVPFTVYVAAGSHATYLTNGADGVHDLVDFDDYTGYMEEHPELVLTALLLVGLHGVVVALIILTIIEHFQDTEDVTSEDGGIQTGPPEVVGQGPTIVKSQLIVLPQSAKGTHIYHSDNEELLRRHAFPGKWGGHDDSVNHSPNFIPKAERFFKELVSHL